MRGCLFTLVLGAIVIGALVVFALPRALEGVITASLATAGFQARETGVKLEQDDPLALIRLKADRVSISALDATIGDLDVGTVDLVLEGVDLGSRTAASVTGTLADASTSSIGTPIEIPEIHLAGDTTKLEAVASIDAADVRGARHGPCDGRARGAADGRPDRSAQHHDHHDPRLPGDRHAAGR